MPDKLTEIVSVRFTAAEMDRLRALAGSRPISHVVRELATRSTQPAVPASRCESVTSRPVGFLFHNAGAAVTHGMRPGIFHTTGTVTA